MKITDVTLTLFAWESIHSTIYDHHFEGGKAGLPVFYIDGIRPI